ncbi:ATP-binding protein [Actinomadura formosensis]|uniref:ATP-binding protein n=1 Tax=Actinomadura formosensis TaxID=60706 RepID=UPI0008319DE5|nr:LuxR C-terminal-related transcriptional regulator [Actinomadura formosensis]
MEDAAMPGPLRDAGVTRREAEVFWLVSERLTNREIADRLGLSERTVESHVSSLLRKLGHAARRDLVEDAARFRRRVHTLPRPLSSFVGRERELRDLAGLVAGDRMVTVTGPAGIGKTRLALRLAHEAAGLPPAVLVDLASVPPGGQVDRAFADALGAGGDGRTLGRQIITAIRARPHWLLVDNCEHVADAVAALLADLLAATDGVRVLATSHGPLGVSGEAVYRLAPLPVPGETADSAEILGCAAVRLFTDRAAAVAPGRTTTPADAAVLAMICRRLDGLPLAIELAAARTRFASPAELLRLLDDRFALLTGGPRPNRHRTLEEALRWSYDLLDDDERLLLDRCSVFPGEFDYDTAVKVLAAPPLGGAGLTRVFPRLLDRSMISIRRHGGTTRYRLLDSVRQFARHRLAERREHEQILDRHTRHHLTHAVSIVPALRGGNQAAALRWFTDRWTDLRAAVGRALDSDDTTAAWAFIAGVGTGWETLGARGELFTWLDTLLDRPLPEGPAGVRAAVTSCFLLCYQDTDKALELAGRAAERAATEEEHALAALATGCAATHRRDHAEAARALDGAAAVFARLGDDWHHALALSLRGIMTAGTATAVDRQRAAAALFGRLGDHVKRANCLNHLAGRLIRDEVRLAEAEACLDEALDLALRTGNDHERLHAQLHRAGLARHRNDQEAATALLTDLLPEFRRIGDLRCAAHCLLGLGRAASSHGRHRHARRHFLEGASIAIAIKDHHLIVTGLRLLAETEHAAGSAARSAELLGAATPDGRGGPGDSRLGLALRSRLGEAAFAAALAAGRRTAPATLLETLMSAGPPEHRPDQ